MARNYNLVVDFSNFKPFDVSLALSTLKDYRSAYDKLEAQANKIAEEKGEYVLPESSKYKEIMDKYNADFDAIVSDFNKGMNYKNATDMRNLVRRYSREVTPIRTMVQNYNKYNDKVLSLGPDAIVGNRERTLDDFYGNINPQISYRNGKTIQQTAAGVMQGLDNALMSAPAQAGSIANQYFILKQQGLNGNDALQKIMQHNPQLNTDQGVQDTSQLLDALDRVYQQYAFEGGTPENSKIWENVVSGAIQGIQAPKYSLQANHDQEIAAQKAQREHAEATTQHLKMQMQQEEENQNLLMGRVYNPQTKKYEENIEKAREILSLKSSLKGKNVGDYKKVRTGGKFTPALPNVKQEQTVSSSEVDKSSVPEHIRMQYPEDTEFIACKDKKGNIIGYIGKTYKDVKVNSSTGTIIDNDSQVSDEDGEVEDE